MTNAEVYQGFHDDKKVEEHWCRWNSRPVVCLSGGERGTCLGPSIFGGPLEVLHAQFFLIFDEKLIHSYNVLQSRSKVSTLLSKGTRTETVMYRNFAFKGASTGTAVGR